MVMAYFNWAPGISNGVPGIVSGLITAKLLGPKAALAIGVLNEAAGYAANSNFSSTGMPGMGTGSWTGGAASILGNPLLAIGALTGLSFLGGGGGIAGFGNQTGSLGSHLLWGNGVQDPGVFLPSTTLQNVPGRIATAQERSMDYVNQMGFGGNYDPGMLNPNWGGPRVLPDMIGNVLNNSSLTPNEKRMYDAIEDPTQRTMFLLQKHMQKQALIMQTLTNISHMLFETAKSIAQNIR
jgi:hypothetical protein